MNVLRTQEVSLSDLSDHHDARWSDVLYVRSGGRPQARHDLVPSEPSGRDIAGGIFNQQDAELSVWGCCVLAAHMVIDGVCDDECDIGGTALIKRT